MLTNTLKKELPFWVVTLLGAYIITGILLMILAFLVYQFHFGENVTNISIIIIYAVVNFVSGFFVGKKKKVKRFLAGFAAGIVYFALLMVISLICNGGLQDFSGNFFTTLVICTGSGMLGGMLS